MQIPRWWVPALGCLLIALPGLTGDAGSSLLVVNKKGESAKDHRGSVTFLDPGTHGVLGSVDTGLRPRWAAFGPERRYVYVLSSGKGGFSAPSKSGTEGTLTVIDVATRAVAASVALDPFPRKALFSPDGRRLFVICGGKKFAPPSVTAIDLTTHAAAGKAVLGEHMTLPPEAPPVKILGFRPSREPHLTAVASAGLLFILRYPWSMESDEPSELLVVDTKKMSVVARHAPLPPRGSWLSLSTDGKRVYAFCRGHPKLRKAEKRDALGALYALDAASGEITSTWSAGFSPTLLGIQRGDDRVFLSAGAAAGHRDRLIVLERGTARTVATPGGPPRHLVHRPGHTEILLSTPDSIVGVDTEDWKIVRTVGLPFAVRQVRIGPDGDRVYVAASEDGRFSYVDLQTGEWAPVLKSGRKGVKIKKGLGTAASVALTVAVVAVSSFAAVGEIESGPFAPFEFAATAAENATLLPVYTGPRASPALGLSQDGQHLLVLNQRTDDVTVADTQQWKILRKVGTGGDSRAILSSPTGRFHYVLAAQQVTVVGFGEALDVLPHRIRDPQRGTPTLYVLQARNEMWLPRKSGMDVFALDTGRFEKSVDGLPRPLMVLSAAEAGPPVK